MKKSNRNRKNRNYPILTTLLFLLIGIVLIIKPDVVGKVLCYVLGGSIIAIALVKIFKFFTDKENDLLVKVNLVIGIFMIAFGIFVIAKPYVIIDFIPVVAGILIIFSSLDRFKKAADLKSSDYRFWWVALIFAIILMVLAVILITSRGIMLRVIGVFLVFDSISNIWSIAKLKSAIKSSKKDIIDID
ncbi:MAG: hypothetical protein GX896_04415 [Clostridiales bacterium]|nr:hypothetical protein [Clostridiales bacterium]